MAGLLPPALAIPMGAPLKTPSTLDKRTVILGTALFASVFLFAGLALGYFLYLRPFMLSRAAQAWTQVPCRILYCELKSHSGKSTTYNLAVTYTYQLNGQDYQSTRFDFTLGSDSDYNWWKAAFNRHHARQADVCFVNPANPAEAVLERDFNRNAMIWIFTGMFSLIGMGMMVPAVRGVIRRVKFGESYFDINDAPVPLGGVLEGAVSLSRVLQPPEGFALRLVSIHSFMTGAGKNRHTEEAVLWEDKQQVISDTGATVPVRFALPVDAAVTEAVTASDRYFWRLEVKAKVPGVDYAAQFEVPVVRGTLTPAQLAEARKLQGDETQDEEHFQLPAHSAIKVQDTMGGREFYFPALRNPGMAFFLLVFTAIFGGALWALFHFHAPFIFPAVFGLFTLLLVIFTTHEFFGTTRVVADGNGVTVTKHLFGLGWSKVIPASDIAEIHTAQGATMSSGSSTAVYYNVQIVCRNGRKITAGDEVSDLHEAHWLALEMARCTGLGKQA